MPKFNEEINARDPSIQKRKKARVRVDTRGELHIPGVQRPIQIEFLDIGPGGVAFQAKTNLYVGDMVRMCFQLTGRLLDVKAEVKRVSGKNVAATFVDLSESDNFAIQECIHHTLITRDARKG